MPGNIIVTSNNKIMLLESKDIDVDKSYKATVLKFFYKEQFILKWM